MGSCLYEQDLALSCETVKDVKVGRRTHVFKGGPVKLLAIHWVLLNLPVASVHDVAMLAAQDQPTAVWNGMSHPQWLHPALHAKNSGKFVKKW